jgi:hypothetical protein
MAEKDLRVPRIRAKWSTSTTTQHERTCHQQNSEEEHDERDDEGDDGLALYTRG